MSIENKVAVITDTGSSIHPDSSLAKELGVTVVPLDIKFYENGEWVSYSDANVSTNDFYTKMHTSDKLPQTSGSIPGTLQKLYERYGKEDRPVISIHITSRHSTVWESAILASNLALENHPHLLVSVIDSKSISIPIWFLAEQAAMLANEGYPLKDITRITLETVPKTSVRVALSTFENVVKGGRLSSAAGYLGTKFQLRPILGLVDGEIKFDGLTRTNRNVQNELIKKVEDTKEDIVKLAVIHTNFIEGAELLKESLSKIYSKEIKIYEAGPAIGVHTGEKSLAVALQKA